MSEMVERVARAMFEDDQFDYEPRMPTWEETGVREEYRSKARIAIRAMREPTQEMLQAELAVNRWRASGEVWRTMIDAALSDAGVTISERPSGETMR